jgi:hypothetical protein
MASKKKRKIKASHALVKSTLLVAKLKASKMPMIIIARTLGYKSHNTVKHWFATDSLPASKLDEIKKMVRA